MDKDPIREVSSNARDSIQGVIHMHHVRYLVFFVLMELAACSSGERAPFPNNQLTSFAQERVTRDPALDGHPAVSGHNAERPYTLIRNLLTLEDLSQSIGMVGEETLPIDFSHISILLDGREVEATNIYGRIYSGPYPFESAESQAIYRFPGHPIPVKEGRSHIPIKEFLEDRYNSENWTDTVSLSVRFELFVSQPEEDLWLGSYETNIRAVVEAGGTVKRLPAIIEGPFVTGATSDAPGSVNLNFKTDLPALSGVMIDGAELGAFGQGRVHSISIDGLSPDVKKSYRVFLDGNAAFPERQLKTAPDKGSGSLRFAFFADTREGYGEGPSVGDRALMGVNADMSERLVFQLEQHKPDFLIVGGDMAFGYSTETTDLRMQFHAFKKTMTSFWSERPVFTVMGNHDAVVDLNANGHRHGVRLDKSPYTTDSSEALFADEFVNPTNAPTASDPRRPSYEENVYSFQYGNAFVIVTNTNYWISNHFAEFGGNPEGYILKDQFDWIIAELNRAERDPTIDHVFIVGHEPVFPNGGHVRDSMYWGGDDRVRPFICCDNQGNVVSADTDGIIARRNRLVEAISSSRKVAAVLSGDEHSYHKTLISRDVPTHEDPAYNPAIAMPKWYISSAGGGASYYAEEPTPWNAYWKEKYPDEEARRAHYVYSSQPHYLIFEIEGERASMRAISAYGEVIDSVENLRALPVHHLSINE